MEISSLTAQVEAARLHIADLASKFEAATTSTKKTKLAFEYDQALKRADALQLLVDLLQRKFADEKAA